MSRQGLVVAGLALLALAGVGAFSPGVTLLRAPKGAASSFLPRGGRPARLARTLAPALAARASAGGWLAEDKDRAKAYEAVTTAWSFSAAANLLTSTAHLPVVLTAILPGAARALYALPAACYLLVLLNLRSLHHAAEEGLLKSDTYKRLNLGMAASSLLSMALALTVWSMHPPDSLGGFAPRALAILSSGMAVLVCGRVWNLTLNDGDGSVGVGGMIAAGVKGTAASALGLLTPRSLTGAVYKLLALLLLAKSALTLFAPDRALALMLGKAFLEGIYAMQAWGGVLLLHAVSAYALADAADRKRLSGTTFRDMNAGFVLTFIVQAFLLGVALNQSGLAVTEPARLAQRVYVGVSAFFAIFCAANNLAPAKLDASSPKLAGEQAQTRPGASSAVEARRFAIEQERKEKQRKALKIQLERPAARKEGGGGGERTTESLERSAQERRKKAIEIQLAQVAQRRREQGAAALKVATDAREAVQAQLNKKDFKQARSIYVDAEKELRMTGLQDPDASNEMRLLDKAIRLAEWKDGAEKAYAPDEAEWAALKAMRDASRAEAEKMLAEVVQEEEDVYGAGNAKEAGDEAYEEAESLIRAGKYAEASAQLDLAAEKWGDAGMMGLKGSPFEDALDQLRAMIPVGEVPAKKPVIPSIRAYSQDGDYSVSVVFGERLAELQEERKARLTEQIEKGGVRVDVGAELADEDVVKRVGGEVEDFGAYLDQLQQKRKARLDRRFNGMGKEPKP